jgi:hypothetical protein
MLELMRPNRATGEKSCVDYAKVNVAIADVIFGEIQPAGIVDSYYCA